MGKKTSLYSPISVVTNDLRVSRCKGVEDKNDTPSL